jgi:hypothetical protein
MHQHLDSTIIDLAGRIAATHAGWLSGFALAENIANPFPAALEVDVAALARARPVTIEGLMSKARVALTIASEGDPDGPIVDNAAHSPVFDLVKQIADGLLLLRVPTDQPLD